MDKKSMEKCQKNSVSREGTNKTEFAQEYNFDTAKKEEKNQKAKVK